ncbi:hypothetical protein CEP54_015797 [Fusarium duplospermum]|uniref:Uncharacterized protein n=1 Tax=Fusarium duplospermum TaxID=1325734 RepID=A0A428NL54_9HYPO|nr:hypothetical protein CEP54_015797 [Fusarium duplospermum]
MNSLKPLPRSPLLSQLRAATDEPPPVPSKLGIPHHPAGKGLPLQSAQEPQKQTGLQPPPPSPAESLSSILSAYCRIPHESSASSSDSASTDGCYRSEANTSSIHEALLPSTKASSTKASTPIYPTPTKRQQRHAALEPPVKDGRPPHRPPKDTIFDLRSTLAPKPPPKTEAGISPVKSSRPRAQQPPESSHCRSNEADWRSLEPDQRLIITGHGPATTAAATSRLTQRQRHGGVTTPPRQRPRCTANSAPTSPSPGKRQALASQRVAKFLAMDSSSSKLSRLMDRLRPRRRAKSRGDTGKSSTHAQLGARWPPTPEYRKEHIKTPIFDSYASPREPAAEAPPELLGGIPQPPPQQGSKASPSANTEPKAVVHRGFIPPTELPGPVETKLPPRPGARAESPMMQALPPLAAGFARNRGSAGSGPADVRTRHLPRRPSARCNKGARLMQSQSGGLLYKGRDGTLYSEMKTSREPDPRAAYFPKQADFPMANGIVIKAPPLKESHFDCHYRHKIMNRRANIYHPLTCQACEKSDVESRWTCLFCHLRICESCVDKLNRNGRDLRRLRDEMKTA